MRSKKLIVALFMMFSLFAANAQMEKYQALFMYKFLQNFEWSSAKISNGYKIGVLGSDALFEELNKMVSGRSISGKSIEVVKYTPGTSTADFCMIFLANRNKDLFESINKSAISTSTIIVGETPGLAKRGAGVNFITAGGSLKFELNQATLNESNVKASGSIKSLAILIN